MQFSISDVAAIAFARGFYTALAYGRGIDEAVRSGRIGILGIGRGTLEWVTPVLYLRGEDAHLFDVTPIPEAPPPRLPHEPDTSAGPVPIITGATMHATAAPTASPHATLAGRPGARDTCAGRLDGCRAARVRTDAGAVVVRALEPGAHVDADGARRQRTRRPDLTRRALRLRVAPCPRRICALGRPAAVDAESRCRGIRPAPSPGTSFPGEAVARRGHRRRSRGGRGDHGVPGDAARGRRRRSDDGGSASTAELRVSMATDLDGCRPVLRAGRRVRHHHERNGVPRWDGGVRGRS